MRKFFNILLWIVLFPIMLTYWGWKKKYKSAMIIGSVLSVLVLVGVFTDSSSNIAENALEDSQLAAMSIVKIKPEEASTKAIIAEINSSETLQEDVPEVNNILNDEDASDVLVFIDVDTVTEGEKSKEESSKKLDSTSILSSEQVKITQLDKKAEYIILKNEGSEPINLSRWMILSVRGKQSFTFSDYTLQPNSTVKVGDSEKNSDVDLHWLDGRGTWNNSDSDPAELYNPDGELRSRYED